MQKPTPKDAAVQIEFAKNHIFQCGLCGHQVKTTDTKLMSKLFREHRCKK